MPRWPSLATWVAVFVVLSGCGGPFASVDGGAWRGERGHALARYIAAMHRGGIHQRFAYAFLPSLAAKGEDDPFNDPDRSTLVGVVIKGDGAVDEAKILRSSGYAPFDAAAIDAVVSSSPFPPPLDSIKSADGEVHIDWVFYRDERECGSFNAAPHRFEPAPPTAGSAPNVVPGHGPG